MTTILACCLIPKMGNKLCKKKADSPDINPKSPFDRIITRLHLRPNSWKSDSSLSDKQVNRYEINPKNGTHPIPPPRPRPLSAAKSADWTTATLEVPGKDEDVLKSTKISTIFNDNSTPTPPPRKHKKGIREKIESVAKSGLQAFQNMGLPASEQICTKKIINYGCPGCDGRHKEHNHPENNHTNEKEKKRAKNLSIVSLPNYSELKLSVANPDKALKDVDVSVNASHLSLPGENKKLSTVSTPGKLENYMTRCRSFGSLLPNQLLNKLKPANTPADVESDDSFGGLEDWDLRIIEHYNPKDASLPRPRKPQVAPRNESAILQDIEGLIEKEDAAAEPPVPPVRRSESMLKKLTRENSETARMKSNEMLNIATDADALVEIKAPPPEAGRATPMSLTPPPSPEPETEDAKQPLIPANLLPTEDENGKVEHSGLMKLLEEFSPKKQEQCVPKVEEIVHSSNTNHVDHDVNKENVPKHKTNDASSEKTFSSDREAIEGPVQDQITKVASMPQQQPPASSRYNAILDFLYAERYDTRSACPK